MSTARNAVFVSCGLKLGANIPPPPPMPRAVQEDGGAA